MAADRLFWNRFAIFETSRLQVVFTLRARLVFRIGDPHGTGPAVREGAECFPFILTFPASLSSLLFSEAKLIPAEQQDAPK